MVSLVLRTVSVGVCLLMAVGCGPNIAPLPDPVEVSGSVSLPAAKEMVLMLQPIETGHLAGLPINAKGAFSGKAIPGKYAYYLSHREPDSAVGREKLKAVPEPLRAADLSRVVVVPSSGGTLFVKLD